MKANGSSRLSTDTWMTIPTLKGNNRTFRHVADPTYNQYSNPYEVLSDSSIHSLQKFRLPNGEVIFTSFQSVNDISAYFLTQPKYQSNTTKIDNGPLNVHHLQTSVHRKNKQKLQNTPNYICDTHTKKIQECTIIDNQIHKFQIETLQHYLLHPYLINKSWLPKH